MKILGLLWDPHSDTFGYHSCIDASQPTKRGILSTIAKLLHSWTNAFVRQSHYATVVAESTRLGYSAPH